MKIVKHENGNASFQRDKIPFLTLNWGWEGYEYWSILTNPCGFILIELMSNQNKEFIKVLLQAQKNFRSFGQIIYKYLSSAKFFGNNTQNWFPFTMFELNAHFSFF